MQIWSPPMVQYKSGSTYTFKQKGGSSPKLTASSYNYKIYFYVGDEKNSNNEKYSVASRFEYDESSKRYKYNGKTKAEIASDIATNMIAELNTLGFGVTFNFVPHTGTLSNEKEDAYYETTIAPWINSANSLWYIDSDADEFSRIVIVNPGSPQARAETNSIRIIMAGFGFYKTNREWYKSAILHEIGMHGCGFNHKDRIRNYPSSGTITNVYGNRNLGLAPFQEGFIHPSEITEDTFSGISIAYNKTATCKVYGQIQDTTNNRKWFYDGFGVAFIVDNYKKEMVYQSPIDQSGYFEFRLFVMPPSTVKHTLLICSGEFLEYFIDSIVDDQGNWSWVMQPAKRTYSNGVYSFSIDNIGEGEIRYYTKAIDSFTLPEHNIGTINPYDGGKSAKLLNDIYTDTGIHMEYSGIRGSAGTLGKEASKVTLNNKVYRSLLTHTSSDKSKPGEAISWKLLWEETNLSNVGVSRWATGIKYYGKFRDPALTTTSATLHKIAKSDISCATN